MSLLPKKSVITNTQNMSSTIAVKPLKGQERKEILDFLRGIALLGILLVNMAYFNAPFLAQISTDFALWDDLPNTVFKWINWLFLEGKFYPMFSMLFGLGFYFFLKKADNSLDPVVFTYRIRLMYLLFFGILHVGLLWNGDILILYALSGFVMTWFKKSSDKTILIWAIVFILLPVVLIAGLVGLIRFAMLIPEAADEIAAAFEMQDEILDQMTEKALIVYSTGSFAEIFRIRLQEYAFILNNLLFMIPAIVSLFLVGIYLGRKKIFQDIDHGVKVMRKIFFWCLPAGLLLSLGYAYYMHAGYFQITNWEYVVILAGVFIGGPAMTFVYLYLIMLLYQKGFFRRITGFISKAGRMAFTNYLTQSIICTTIFYSYGLGLYGKVNIWQGFLLAIAIYIIQVTWSHYWLKHYNFGPFEWLWRSMTYRKWQPMKRT